MGSAERHYVYYTTKNYTAHLCILKIQICPKERRISRKLDATFAMPALISYDPSVF